MGAWTRAVAAVAVAVGCQLSASGQQPAPGVPLPAPGFHHLHLNSVNPDAAIEFYTRAFPSTSRATFAGQPALASPNNVLVLFTKVTAPPATQPQTSFWHFGWHVTDVRATLARYLEQNLPLLPLYTGEGTRTVFVSSDTYPGTGGMLGLTRAQVNESKERGVKPAGGAGFAYLRGPDDALVEYQGNMAAERFNHVHMYQDQPFCAQLWYQAHLNVSYPAPRAGAAPPVRTAANCRVERGADKTLPALEWDGMYRTTSLTSTTFGDVSLFWYMNQTGMPAAPTRGHLMDHFALGVNNFDAWVAKLKGENVTVLRDVYNLAEPSGPSVAPIRALMIEGPSREAIEIVEVKK